MQPRSRELFVRLMMMTTSSYDPEVLVAIRKANNILAEANINWEELLAAIFKEQQKQPPPPPPNNDSFSDVNYTDADEINRLFQRAFRRINPGSSFYEFVQNVHEFWSDRGYLTPKQYEAIKKAAR